jgi:branched-subunit amino acid aminotransferase/4-amino-4-deoxychorismate lyase
LLTPEGGADRVCRFEVGGRGVQITERTVGDTQPVRLVLASAIQVPYPHKTTDRAQFDRALREARAAGADDALFRSDGLGYVTEAAIWSIFWWEGQTLCAPPLDLGILPGVARARLAELVGVIADRRVTPEHLAGRSLFVANATRGVVPVSELGGRVMPADPGTLALTHHFWP